MINHKQFKHIYLFRYRILIALVALITMIENEDTSIDHTLNSKKKTSVQISRHISGDLRPPQEYLCSRNPRVYFGQLLSFLTQSRTNLESISSNIQNVTNIYYENKLSTIALFNRIEAEISKSMWTSGLTHLC